MRDESEISSEGSFVGLVSAGVSLADVAEGLEAPCFFDFRFLPLVLTKRGISESESDRDERGESTL